MSSFENIENLHIYAATYNQHLTQWSTHERLPAVASLNREKLKIFALTLNLTSKSDELQNLKPKLQKMHFL